MIYLYRKSEKLGKNVMMCKGVHKSIPFFDFFFLSKPLFLKKGLSRFMKYVYYFCSFWGEKNETFKRNERCINRIRYFVVDYDRSFDFYTTIFLVNLLKFK